MIDAEFLYLPDVARQAAEKPIALRLQQVLQELHDEGPDEEQVDDSEHDDDRDEHDDFNSRCVVLEDRCSRDCFELVGELLASVASNEIDFSLIGVLARVGGAELRASDEDSREAEEGERAHGGQVESVQRLLVVWRVEVLDRCENGYREEQHIGLQSLVKFNHVDDHDLQHCLLDVLDELPVVERLDVRLISVLVVFNVDNDATLDRSRDLAEASLQLFGESQLFFPAARSRIRASCAIFISSILFQFELLAAEVET